jgi:hypothetical protein
MPRPIQTVVMILIAALAACRKAPDTACPSSPLNATEAAEAVRQHKLEARLRAGRADPTRDADAAAAAGDFRLIFEHYVAWGRDVVSPLGLHCQAPLRPRDALASWSHGDGIDLGDPVRVYGLAYNAQLAASPSFPYADICAPAGDGGHAPPGEPHVPSRPPLDIAEAARRGALADVKRLETTATLDRPDLFGMTPLAWAAAHGRDEVVTYLLARGARPGAAHCADPDARYPIGEFAEPAWMAVRYGHPLTAQILQRAAGPALQTWPARYGFAAMSSNDLATVKLVFDAPHQPLAASPEMPAPPMSNSAAVAFVLQREHNRDLSDSVFLRAVKDGDLDAARLAVRFGAHRKANGEMAFNGQHPQDPQIVRLVLAMGEDPNRHMADVVTRAVLNAHDPKSVARDLAILDALLDAGARGETSSHGQPDRAAPMAITATIGPYSPDIYSKNLPRSGRALPPGFLRRLAARGMDVNARWNGRPALTWVREIYGRDSEAAITLRSLGAREDLRPRR